MNLKSDAWTRIENIKLPTLVAALFNNKHEIKTIVSTVQHFDDSYQFICNKLNPWILEKRKSIIKDVCAQLGSIKEPYRSRLKLAYQQLDAYLNLVELSKPLPKVTR